MEPPESTPTRRNRTASSRQSMLTRRRALGVAGSGLLAGVLPSASAETHDAEVRSEGGTWIAEAHGSQVYSGGDMFAAVRAAIDGLTRGRTTKETVIVRDGGTASGTIGLPDYTVVDFRGTITHTGSDIPIYADGAQAIEIPNYSLEGTPDMGMRLQRCRDVVLGDIEIAGGPGIGIRIDNAYETGNAVTTEGVRIDSARISGTDSHGLETYGVDDIEIGTVETRDTGGCGLLLNDTSNAEVELVDAVRADEGGGYAGFRCANDAGPGIHVEEVRATECGRGLFTVSGSHGITIDAVEIQDCGSNLIQDSRDVTIDGGTIQRNAGEGVRIDSRSEDSHHHTRDVTVQNVGIYENDYGVLETGPDTEANAIVDNDFCDNGTDIETYAESTVVSGNTTCEGPPDGGNGNSDAPDIDPAALEGRYRIERADSDLALSIDGGSTEAGASVVQRLFQGEPDQYWHLEHLGDGVHRLENEHSGLVLDVYGAQTEAGADVIQWEGTGDANQRFRVGALENGDLAVVSEHSDLVLGVSGQAHDAGASVVQESWADDDGQRWAFVEATESSGGVIELDGYEARDTTGDGLYNDVTGDGDTTHDDVTAFFEHLEDDGVQNNPDAFDFADNGAVGFSDVIELLRQV